MRRSTRGSAILALGLLACAVIAAVDYLTPLEVDVWLGYLAVVSVVAWLGSEVVTYLLACSYSLNLPGFLADAARCRTLACRDQPYWRSSLALGAAVLISRRRILLDAMADQAESLRMANQALEQQTVELRRANDSLREMPTKLIEVQENERRGISRELHDESSQILTAIIMRLGLMRRTFERDKLDTRAIDKIGVMAGAVDEPRIKALIANPATHNIFSSAIAQQSSNGRSDPVARLVFQQLGWRFGLSLGNIPARLVRAVEFMLYARADVTQIACPTLCMAGESEAKVTLEQTRQTYERLPNPRKHLAILTKDVGGAAHCQIDNLELLNRVIFDWLGEVWRTDEA